MADRGYGRRTTSSGWPTCRSSTLEHYRTAHDISACAADKESSTEELRQAIVDYRTLFEDLLEAGTGGTAKVAPQTGGEPQRRTAAGDASAPMKG